MSKVPHRTGNYQQKQAFIVWVIYGLENDITNALVILTYQHSISLVPVESYPCAYQYCIVVPPGPVLGLLPQCCHVLFDAQEAMTYDLGREGLEKGREVRLEEGGRRGVGGGRKKGEG